MSLDTYEQEKTAKIMGDNDVRYLLKEISV